MTKGQTVKLSDVIESMEVEWPSDEYETARFKPGENAENRRPHREKMQSAPFIAWDGEGYSDKEGTHHYMLFGNSLGESVLAEHDETLSWRECFPLLLESRKGINVIFGGDYDIIMMIKDMPFIVRNRLFKGLAVRYGGYRMRWFRRKFFLLSETRGLKRRTVLYDVQSFFQCSFVNACKEYLGDDETLQRMHAMKLKRDSFTQDDENVKPYWHSELDYLVKLMDMLRLLLSQVEIKPRGWYGPGAVASALMNSHKMRQYYKAPIPPEVIDIGERAYYGGRFEQFKVGKFDNVYEYDIRSAYPSMIARLPDFSNVTWEYVENPTRLNDFALYEVSWDIKQRPWVIGPFPWRDDRGRIFFPWKGSRSWYWGVELRQCLLRSFPKDMYEIHAAWLPTFPKGTIRPFHWVPRMYEDRARMKADGNPAQKALKLGLNSLYGKLAQSTGAKLEKDGTWSKPSWHHILWAGWVTAATRARLFDAIRKQNGTLIAMETDALFTTKPLTDIPIGDELGQWEETRIEQILYVHSGVYYALNDGVWRLKSRGVESDKTKSADYWLDIFARVPQTPVTITQTLRRFGTDIRQTEHFAKWYDFEISTNIPLAFSKRMHNLKRCPTCFKAMLNRETVSYADDYHFLTVPQTLLESDWIPSTPYNFPWRDDVDYDWPSVIKSEAIELPEEIAWTSL